MGSLCHGPQRYAVGDRRMAQPVVTADRRARAASRAHEPKRRQATLSLRYSALTVCPPRHRKREGVPTVALSGLLVRAVEPPATGEPLEWLLLTTVAVDSVDDAVERVQCVRVSLGPWVWQSISKSGRRLDSDAHMSPQAARLRVSLRLQRAGSGASLRHDLLARSAARGRPARVLLTAGRIAGAVRRPSIAIPQPPPEPPALGPGRQLDRAARRVCGAPPPRSTWG